MMHVAPLEACHREMWDAVVASDPTSGFMQSWTWSEFKALEGYTVVRLGLFDGETLQGGGIAYTFPSLAEAGLAVMPDGPVLDWEAPSAPTAFQTLIAAFRNSPAGRQAVALRIEPRLEAVPEFLRDLPRAPVDLVPDETLMVDLGPERKMLACMKPKGRYNARLALRRGVEVVSSSDPIDVHEFHFVLEQTARYQDFRLEPKRFFINLVQALFPCVLLPGIVVHPHTFGAAPRSAGPPQQRGRPGSGSPPCRLLRAAVTARRDTRTGNSRRLRGPAARGGTRPSDIPGENLVRHCSTGRLAFARYKGITLAAALTVWHGRTVTYLYGGHLPLFPEMMASYALHWHILREAAKEGYLEYDFYGYVPPGPPGHPYDGFSRFKEKFGGRPVRWIGSRDVIFHDRLAEATLRAIHSIPADALLAGTTSQTREHRGEKS
jgi:lipid II:glycine glycyltransferase (peptidoglycan interpeptide bridge formation enzyme)